MALLTSPKSAPWDIYPKELAVYGYGTALWEPNPPYISGRLVYEQIEVGDVGLIRHGSFMLLFNVFLDRSHPRQRHVPHDFRPLQLVESISDAGMFLRQIAPCTGTLNSVPLMTEYVTCTSTSASVIPGGLPLQAGIELSFQFSKKSGATLVFQQPARKYEIEQIGLLEQYVRDQYKSWTSFARGSGYSIDLEDLRVVTGVVRTADWAMAISQGTNSALNATASLVMPGILNNSASHQRYWRSPNQTIVTNCGPILVADGLGGNQTIFVGAFVMKARRLLPTKIRAAAGPHDFDSDDRDADSSPEVLCDNGKDESPDIVQIPDHGKDINVLSPVLDYILDTCPGADIAMARDSDLLPYLDGRYDADQLIKRLRDFAPDVVLNDGVGTLKHKPFSVMLDRITLDTMSHNIQLPVQELLRLAKHISALGGLLPGNRLMGQHLAEWCCEIALLFGHFPHVNINSLAEATGIMEDIESHLRFWLDMSTAIVMHEQIQSRIQKYHIRLRSFCLKSELRTFSGIEKLRGDSELLDLSKKDHLALLEQLCDESAFRSIMEKIDARNHATLDAISILIQQRMSKFDSEDRRQRGLQRHERGPMPGPRSTADRRCNSVGWIILLLYAVYLILVLLALRYTSLHEWDGKTRKQDVIVVGI